MGIQISCKGVLILGAGGHGKVVADTLLCQGAQVSGFLDDVPAKWGTTILGIPVLGGVNTCWEHCPGGLLLGIGSNAIRKQIATTLGPRADRLWCNAIHPRAVVSASVRIAVGVVIVAGAVVNVDASLGSHVIINTCASVDHDCVVGDYVHIAPGAHLAGGVTVGEGAFIGAGAVVVPGCTIGKWANIGAGAVVVRDIPDNVIAKGVPARW